MELTREMVADTINRMFRRAELARLAGGIALSDVVDRKVEVPDGWQLDPYTNFFLPPNVNLDETRTQ